jgi:hypothetical protein
MSPAFARAINVAFYCLVAQLFLSLAGLIVAASILSLIALDPSVVVTIPVAAFAIYVGISALRRARDVMAGLGPLL